MLEVLCIERENLFMRHITVATKSPPARAEDEPNCTKARLYVWITGMSSHEALLYLEDKGCA
ncbi:MAG TPA: hypothetical protein ENN80_00445 [Candidatus Hydrogenedentes bacterium]|nr:hypothetical protein [Candidatus Hydrogenedentota bacterium]